MNKICVYAIAKNEAKNVELWYNSMKEADHIIVLDTGSTDNTVELLASLGVEVHSITYDKFMFDVARNDAMALVPQEYNILVSTDLDERFEEGWAEKLREKGNPQIHQRAHYLYTGDHLEDGSNGHTFLYNKIHTRDGIGKDPLHENLFRKSNLKREYTEEEICDLSEDVHLHHYQDLSIDRNGYVELGELRLQNAPEDPLTGMELQREYTAKRLYQKGIDLSLQMIEKKDMFSTTDLASIYHQLGICYFQLQDGPNAMAAYMHGIAIDTLYRENYCELINLCIINGFFDMAIGLGEQAIKVTQERGHWTESSYSLGGGLYDELAVAYHYSDNIPKALYYIQKALAIEPTNEHLKENLNNILQSIY